MALLNGVLHGKLLCLNLPIVTRKLSTQKKSCEKIQSDNSFGFFFSENVDSNLDIPSRKKHGDQTAAHKQQFQFSNCKKPQRFVTDSEEKTKTDHKTRKTKRKIYIEYISTLLNFMKKNGCLNSVFEFDL